jgi:YHS domain-containing protein
MPSSTVLALLLASIAMQRDSAHDGASTQALSPALRGLDPVELCRGRQTPGVAEHALDHHAHRYLFASEESLAAFQSDPPRYEIQFGGACASMGPLSMPADPNLFVVWSGRIYCFAWDSCRQSFLDDPPAHIDLLDEPPAGSPEKIARGAELVALALKGLGGAERVDALQNIALRLDPIVDDEGRELIGGRVWTIAFPNRVRDERIESGVRTVHATSGEKGFAQWAGRVDPLHPSQRALLEREARRLVPIILKSRKLPEFRAVARGAAEVDGRAVEHVAVSFSGLTTALSVDLENGRVLRQQHVGRAGGGPNGMLVLEYSDFREVDGLVLPFARKVLWNSLPARHLSFTWSEVRVDEELAPELFEPPSPPK